MTAMCPVNTNDQHTQRRIVEALIAPGTSINAANMAGVTPLATAMGAIKQSAEGNTHLFPASLCIRLIEAGQKAICM